MLDELRVALGEAYVLIGADCKKWCRDWTGAYSADPIAVLRPANTAQIAQIMQLASKYHTAVVPVSGNTGLTGGASGQGMLLLSVDRLNEITEIDAKGHTATVGAGVVLSNLHAAAEAQGLIFPLTFGARGSAMIGGVLSTNAGGSNVLRYGNTRDLCLGLEVVTADGQVMNLMGKLHKDNAGLNLKHLMIGAEGTLGIITAAVLRLHPKPLAYATAMVAAPSLPDALELLHVLQAETANAVEAFEYMPRSYIDGHLEIIAGARAPFAECYDVNILVEVGATATRDAFPNPDGTIPVQEHLTGVLGRLMEDGKVLDAVVAQSQSQRIEMWARREAAAEVAFHTKPFIDTDIAVAVTDVEKFLTRAATDLSKLDPTATDGAVAHLGDGNIHYTVYPSRDDPDLKDAVKTMVEKIVIDLQGSFSAEHGVGLSKLSSMARCKDPVALSTMRAIKTALDPLNILNPGKVFPPTT